MRGRTLLFLSVLILVFLGWMFPEWLLREFASIPYYTETAMQIQEIQDETLVPFYDSFLKQPYMWLLEHIWMVAGGYGLVSLFMIATTKDPSGGWVFLWFLCVATVVLIVWFFGGMWLAVACKNISHAHLNPFIHSSVSFGSWLIAVITLLLALALTLALTLTFWIAIPIYVLVVLLLLPNVLYTLFRSAILSPFLLWHYLHYLFVPHPAEQIYKAGMARGVALPELAREVGHAMYMHDLKLYADLPPVWKIRNTKRRIEEFTELIKAQGAFQKEFEKYVWQESGLHD